MSPPGTGFVVCNNDGTAKNDYEMKNVSYFIRLRRWSLLRVTFVRSLRVLCSAGLRRTLHRQLRPGRWHPSGFGRGASRCGRGDPRRFRIASGCQRGGSRFFRAPRRESVASGREADAFGRRTRPRLWVRQRRSPWE